MVTPERPTLTELREDAGRLAEVAAALAALALSCACTAAPVDTTRTVIAGDPGEVDRIQAQLDHFVPAIRRLLPGTWEVALEVVVEEEWGNDYPTGTGYTLLDPGRRRASIHLNGAGVNPRETLVHELVHALMGNEWRTLPPVVEEGLATWVAERFEPPDAWNRAARLAHVGNFFGEYVIPVEYREPGAEADEWVQMAVWVPFEEDAGQSSTLGLLELCGRNEYLEYARAAGLDRSVRFQEVGHLLARQILERRGTAGLYALCLRAWDRDMSCVPSEWLLEAAGFATREDWLAAAWGTLDREAFEVLLVHLPELSTEPLAWVCEERLLPLLEARDPALLWERCDPRIRFADGGVLRLAEIEDVRRVLRAARRSR